ncbi:MAG: phosphatase PAP2 family protein [Bacteroidota bacterium]
MRIITIFFMIFVAKHCFASLYQTPPDTIIDDITINKEKVWILKAFFEDEKKLWTSPVKLVNKEKIYWAPVLAATIFALSRDEEIYAKFKSFQAKYNWVSDISPKITLGGDNITVLSTCALFYFGGLAFNNEKAKQTGLLSIQALVHAGLIVTIGKYFSGRQRPSCDNGKDYWHWFPTSLNAFKEGYSQADYDAFPSGHTIAAWSVATVIAKQYRDKKIIPVICYSIATCVGLSRITEDKHWMSDVIIGGALGYSIGSFVVRERSDSKFSIFPVTNGEAVMIGASIKL